MKLMSAMGAAQNGQAIEPSWRAMNFDQHRKRLHHIDKARRCQICVARVCTPNMSGGSRRICTPFGQRRRITNPAGALARYSDNIRVHNHQLPALTNTPLASILPLYMENIVRHIEQDMIRA
jgi:hypothetical protein